MAVVEVYKCIYRELEQIFPRHYTSSLAECTRSREVSLSEVEGVLTREQVDLLLSDGELVVHEERLIEKLLGRSEASGAHVYLRLKIKTKSQRGRG